MNSPASLVDELMAQLQGAPLQQMAQQLGTSPAQTQDAVGAALPMLLGPRGRIARQRAQTQRQSGATRVRGMRGAGAR